jgi:hypothetical protein
MPTATLDGNGPNVEDGVTSVTLTFCIRRPSALENWIPALFSLCSTTTLRMMTFLKPLITIGTVVDELLTRTSSIIWPSFVAVIGLDSTSLQPACASESEDKRNVKTRALMSFLAASERVARLLYTNKTPPPPLPRSSLRREPGRAASDSRHWLHRPCTLLGYTGTTPPIAPTSAPHCWWNWYIILLGYIGTTPPIAPTSAPYCWWNWYIILAGCSSRRLTEAKDSRLVPLARLGEERVIWASSTACFGTPPAKPRSGDVVKLRGRHVLLGIGAAVVVLERHRR